MTWFRPRRRLFLRSLTVGKRPSYNDACADDGLERRGPGHEVSKEKRLSELCRVFTESGLPARLEGEDRVVGAVNTLEDAVEGEITFLSNAKYLPLLAQTAASALIVKDGVAVPPRLAAIRCADPYAVVTVAIITLHGHRQHPQWGLSDRARIHPTARIGADANIAPGVTIAAQVVIGDRCTIYPGCYVADHARMGHQCTLFPNAVIYDYCVLGDRCTIHAGSVIGEDGLGYAPYQGKWLKIPQVGRAVLGDDVEIGANCAIDRATLGQTEIGAGTKFGNSIVIGHGSKIGADCMLVAQVGVAGSVTVGRHVTLAGQVAVAGHLSIGDEVKVGGQSGIHGDVAPGTEVLGTPAIPLPEARRAMIAVQQLPQWLKRIRDLEREVGELRARIGPQGPS